MLVRLLLQISLLLGLTLLVEVLPSDRLLSVNFLDEVMTLAMQESMNKSLNARSWQALCTKTLNRDCTNLEDLADVICYYYENFSNTIDQEVRRICNLYSISCTNLSNAKDTICTSLGRNSQECKMLVNVSNYVTILRNSCEMARNKTSEVEAMRSRLASYLSDDLFFYGVIIGLVLILTSLGIGFKIRGWDFFLDLFASLLILGILYLTLYLTMKSILSSFTQVRELKSELPLTFDFFLTTVKTHLLARAELCFMIAFLPLACWLGKRFIFS